MTKSIRDFQEYFNTHNFLPGENLGCAYGFMRGFFTKEEIESADIRISNGFPNPNKKPASIESFIRWAHNTNNHDD